MILHSVTTQLQFLLIAVAGWMSRYQQAVIEYLQQENRILLEQLGGKPNRFTDAQRIRLARKAKLVGRRRLGKLATRTVQKLERRESGMIASKFVATLDLISLLHPFRVRDQLSADGPKTRTLQKRARAGKTCQRAPAPLGTE